MTWLLDTNILIYLMKHKPPAVVERIASASDDDIVAMSFVTYAELVKGAEGSNRCKTGWSRHGTADHAANVGKINPELIYNQIKPG